MTTAAGPWSVKGIDPKAREIAKDLARRSGLTLGEWLNQMITDTGEEPPPPVPAPPAYADADAPPRSWGEARSAPRAPAQEGSGGVLNAESFRSRLREAGRGGDAAETARVTKALADFTARMEAAEHRSTLAISGIDQQAMGVLSRLDGVERDSAAVGARFDTAVDEVRETQARLAERVRRMELEENPRAEALKALEGALGKVASQVYDVEDRARAQAATVQDDLAALGRRVDRTETSSPVAADTTAFDAALSKLAERMDEAQSRTGAAMRALETSFAGLDQRLARAEAPSASPAEDDEPRLQRLAAELNGKVDDARAEMAARLQEAADGKLDRMESALQELSGQMAETERRSAGAIDRLGREVVRIAQGLDGRVGEVERRAHDTARELEGGMTRIAEAVEGRLSHADSAQAEALQKLGGEIARIADRLAERIAASERRGAEDLTRGLDEVGEHLTRVTDKLNTRYDGATSEIADRIRASEERTARLLDEARGRVEAQSPAPAPAPVEDDFQPFSTPEPQAAAAPASAAPPPAAPPPAAPPLAAPVFATAPQAERAWASPVDGEEADMFRPGPFDAAPADDDFEDAFQSGPFGRSAVPAASDPFPHLEGLHDDDFGSAPPAAAEPPARPSSTRELIESARAAARANADRSRRPSRAASGRPAVSDEEGLFAAPAAGFEAEAPAAAESGRGGFGLPLLRRRREASTLKTALYASGTSAFLAVAAIGAVSMVGAKGGRATTTTEAPTAATAAPAGQPEMLAVAQTPAPDAAPPASPPTEAAVAAPLRPEPVVEAAAAPPTARGLYNEAVRQLERGDAGGSDAMRRAADLGYGPAQFHLAKLYEDGAGGLKRDMAQARRWTERAARAGDPKAMFNLGLYLANGEGVARDDRAAVEWFRRAADGGVKDAQFNLAVMNQNGRGAAPSSAEAYKWFLIAAADGDAGARQSAESLRTSLSPDAQAAAERSAAAYRSQLAAVAAAGAMRTAAR